MNGTTCLGMTKSGNPCLAKAHQSGYCPIHDPAKISKREKERQEKEAAAQAAEAMCKPLREVINVIKTTCKGKGWKVSEQHFDNKTGRHSSLEISRAFNKGGIYDTVTGTLDITYNRDKGLRYSLEGTSFHKYGIKDLEAAIRSDLQHSVSWLTPLEKPSQTNGNDALQKLELLLSRFHRVAHQLTLRHENRETLLIRDEYDVQDLLHALLLTLFDDVRAEDPVPTRAGKASRLDFFLKKEKIMVEAKMTSETLRDAKIGEQLIIDIERHQARPECETLLCFVYDPGHYLKNPKTLDDLNRKHDRLKVKVIVYNP
jgi:hypothetical protein